MFAPFLKQQVLMELAEANDLRNKQDGSIYPTHDRLMEFVFANQKQNMRKKHATERSKITKLWKVSLMAKFLACQISDSAITLCPTCSILYDHRFSDYNKVWVFFKLCN